MNDESIVKVLIVEDEPALREVYQMILTMQGFRVVTAANGILALNAVRKDVPDVVLLDVLMPEMDGLEFMRNLDIDSLPDMKIIVSSNIAEQEIINQMLALGAHRHVLKSDITPNMLVELIQETIADQVPLSE